MSTVHCPDCDAHLEVPEDHEGDRARCRRCGFRFDLPPNAPSLDHDEHDGAAPLLESVRGAAARTTAVLTADHPAFAGLTAAGRATVGATGAGRIVEAIRARPGAMTMRKSRRPLAESPSLVIGLGAIGFIGVPAAVIALIEILGALSGP